jgi:hypothetical protein
LIASGEPPFEIGRRAELHIEGIGQGHENFLDGGILRLDGDGVRFASNLRFRERQ